MIKTDQIIKEFPKATWIGLAVFLVILLIRYLTNSTIDLNTQLVYHLGFSMLYGYSLYYANWFIFTRLYEVSGKDDFNWKRILIASLISIFTTLFIIFLLRILEEVIIEKKSLANFLINEKPANYIIAFTLTLIVTLAMHAFYFYKAIQENKVKEQQIIAGTASAQFESLKNQIDPHFLFNSLNVLSSLIDENPENAQKFTTSLSKIYRYVLEQKDKDLVPVSEELDFANTYVSLLKMRFENSITFEIQQKEELLEAKVVPLSLQLLLENCIKHNVVSEQKPLHIKIYFEKNYLVIQNNLQKKEILKERKGIGIQNIVNRFAILTDRKVLVDETSTHFNVQLPLLTKQLSIMETTNQLNENQSYYRAQKRVKEIKEFYSNLLSYCLVIPFLIFINLKTSPQYHWFWFPMLGWGMGLAFHAFGTFGYGKDWEDRKIKELMNKEDQSTQKWN